MERRPDWIKKRQSLRKKSEDVLAGVSQADKALLPYEVLQHELLVHKVELEMQIEELRRSHIAMEEARDLYVDLYDFSPVGYITINRECLISEINLTGAALLGVDRAKLVNRRFSQFISPQDQDRWHSLFLKTMKDTGTEKQAFVFEMTRSDGFTFHAYLDCRRRESLDAPPTLRLVMIDIGKIKQAEAEKSSV
ncbi:PAS domain-containing protein [Candidatus Methylospira mobilis]|uniref:PAS domain-containing protein n=1 Tax=Candidatus Methylospira mobilis TaxID=1808979 RepID=UPI001D1758ED|nr:PAS domain-containing protein [Candidatus Methylospira mobilis]